MVNVFASDIFYMFQIPIRVEIFIDNSPSLLPYFYPFDSKTVTVRDNKRRHSKIFHDNVRLIITK